MSTNFTIGAKCSSADDNTKMVTFRKNGEVIGDADVDGQARRLYRQRHLHRRRQTHHYRDGLVDHGVPVSSADGYRTPVDFATRMSYSGIFFHSAPPGRWGQGNTNTSHGCLNLSPDNAKWVMDNTHRGDPVRCATAGGTLPGTDGLGDWNIPWSTWSKGNA